jgi:hypothetical protein
MIVDFKMLGLVVGLAVLGLAVVGLNVGHAVVELAVMGLNMGLAVGHHLFCFQYQDKPCHCSTMMRWSITWLTISSACCGT